MKKIKTFLLKALPISALLVSIPNLSFVACSKNNGEQELTLKDDQRIQTVTGNINFEIVFNCSNIIATSDEFDIEVLNLESTNDSTVIFEYDKQRSIVDEDGLKLILKGILSRNDGSAIVNDSNLKFDLQINFANAETGKSWTKSFEDFDITYMAEEANITVVPGQENLYTYPESDIQCLKFQLNGSIVSEETSHIGLETTILGETTGNVKGVEIVAPASGHRVFDVVGDVLYVWVHFIYNEATRNEDENPSATFKARLYCQETISGVLTTIWDKSFDEEFKLTKDLNSGVLVPGDEKLDNGIGHSAGELKKKYRLYVSDQYKDKKPIIVGDSTGEDDELVIDAINVDEEISEDEAGYYYWGFEISFKEKTSINTLEDGDDIHFKLTVTFSNTNIEYVINDFLFTFISQKVVDDQTIEREQYTNWSENWKMFETSLVDNYNPDKLDYIQYDIIPKNIDPEKHITIGNRRQNVMLKTGEKAMRWDAMLKNTSLAQVLPKDCAKFDVIFTGFKDKTPVWKQTLEDFKLTKLNTPITPIDPMNQTLDPIHPTGYYRFTLGKSIEKIEDDNIKIEGCQITGSTVGKQFKIEGQSIELVEGSHNVVMVKLPLAIDGSGTIEGGDFVEFDLTIVSNEDDYKWEQTVHGRMQVWQGFKLWRGCEVEATAKGDKQWFLSSGVDEVINAGISGGDSTKVTVDTNDWYAQTGTPWTSNRRWMLCVPHDIEHEGLMNYYHFDESSIEVYRTRNGETTKLVVGTDYQISSGGPIMTYKDIVQEGDILEFNVSLINGAKVDIPTWFYFSYI